MHIGVLAKWKATLNFGHVKHSYPGAIFCTSCLAYHGQALSFPRKENNARF